MSRMTWQGHELEDLPIEELLVAKEQIAWCKANAIEQHGYSRQEADEIWGDDQAELDEEIACRQAR
jgi:hypothetical protein